MKPMRLSTRHQGDAPQCQTAGANRPDVIEDANPNRVHGLRRADADAAMRKVDRLARGLDLARLATQVITVPTWVGCGSACDVLKACDVIFGCADDHDGRILLNRLVYFYSVSLIDVWLRMRPAKPPLPVNPVPCVRTICPVMAVCRAMGLAIQAGQRRGSDAIKRFLRHPAVSITCG